jgi:hypothetical protein
MQIVRSDQSADSSFLTFWHLYPLKVAKKDAFKAWGDLRPSPATVEAIMTALAWQVPLWSAQGYGMPYPATYLRGERWTDEAPPAVQPKDHRPAWAR